MELFYNIVSPPSRSVLMLAKHLGIESELTMKSVNLRAGEHMTEDYVQMNPQHCVPTLLTEDGVAIWESNAILIYLAERFDQEEKVYSKDLAKRAQINQRLCFDLGTLYKNIRAYYGPLAMGRSKPSEDLLKQIDQSVGYLEGFLSKTQFVAADSLTIADFAVITSVTVASALKHDFSKFPNVTRWIADCKGSIVGFEEITKKAEDTWKATLEENIHAYVMDLYYTIVSPPSRSVLLLAKQLGVELNLKNLNLAGGEHLTEDFRKVNPQHCVPTLVTEDGVAIWESNAILVYLAERFDLEGAIYPKDLTKRAVVQQRLCFDLGTLYKNIRAYYGPLALGLGTPGEDVLKQVDQALEILESFLANSKFVAGDSLTLADFAVITSVTVASTMKHDMGKFPNVTRWVDLCKVTISGAKKRAVINQRLYFDMGTLYQRFALHYYPQVLEGKPAPEGTFKQFEDALQFLETFLAQSKYLAGDSLTIADISLLATITTFKVAAGLDLSRYGNIERWYGLVSASVAGHDEICVQGSKQFAPFFINAKQ
ncbi:hypothetical protein quinque_012627 [Culex quinquefasciatus]